MEIQEGRPDAYAEVLRRCLVLLGNPHDAEDATQEVFARAAVAGRGDLDWLFGVASHVCMDEYRRRSRLDRALARAGVDGDVADPESAATAEVLTEQMLQRLSPTEQRLLRHRVTTAATLDETAAALGIAASTARNLAMRIRQKLRPLLPQLGPLGAGRWLRRLRLRTNRMFAAEPMIAPAAAAIIALTLGTISGLLLPARVVPAVAAAGPGARPVAILTPPPPTLDLTASPPSLPGMGSKGPRTPSTPTRPAGGGWRPPPPPGICNNRAIMCTLGPQLPPALQNVPTDPCSNQVVRCEVKLLPAFGPSIGG